MRPVRISDSRAVSNPATKVYLLRTATLIDRGGKFEVGWKAARGSVPFSRAPDAAPYFAEMAVPGTVFEGDYRLPLLFRQPEAIRALRWKAPASGADLVRAANRASTLLLNMHRKFAETAGLAQIIALSDALLKRVEEAQAAGRLLTCIGWGTGLLAKSVWPAAAEQFIREGLGRFPGYDRAVRTGLPFPKTRRLIIRNNRPVSMPGWVELELL